MRQRCGYDRESPEPADRNCIVNNGGTSMERTENRTEVNIGFGKGRIESLTDGIFAFGMTLLVLGAGYPFTVATLAKTPAHDILVNSVPDVILYMISFLLLAAFWVAH